MLIGGVFQVVLCVLKEFNKISFSPTTAGQKVGQESSVCLVHVKVGE